MEKLIVSSKYWRSLLEKEKGYLERDSSGNGYFVSGDGKKFLQFHREKIPGETSQKPNSDHLFESQ